MSGRAFGRRVTRVHWKRSLGLGLAVVALVGCEAGPPTVGEPKDFTNVCDKANDGHRVAVEGYMRLPETITVRTPTRGAGKVTEIVVVRLFQTQKFNGTPIGVDVGFGTEANTMDELPNGSAGYTDEDLHVHVAGGQTVTYGQLVKVSGTVYFPVIAGSDVEFPCGLGNPLIEPMAA
jgi:hypothetical protein